MSQQTRHIALAVSICLSGPIRIGWAQGYPPTEAAERMSVADGFRVELVASEPTVRQPVAIEFDDRGRLWVIQYLQYPNPEGLKRVTVDRYSRTEYDRIPEPPPHGPRGRDRITILEDKHGDGRVDQFKDFIDGLNLASGLAFGHGGVFVLNVPYLLFYPDRDRDDRPDSDPEVVLSGFGMQDAHSVANSLTWGPDGWLYGCQGSTVTANIRGIEFQQGVWRYHPVSKQFELFCEGGGNSWGLDFDEDGQLLYSTNMGGHVMLHGVQGGYLWKSFGKHGALHNPFAFGYFDHVPHDDFRGGHVTVGGTFYYGTSFPAEFRGAYIAADLLEHAVYWHRVERQASTFRSRYDGRLLNANDTWFAPSDVVLGPDGAIYVCDWHDQRTAHPDPDAGWDRRNGRIYRIQASGTRNEELIDVQALSGRNLIRLLSHANDWYVRRARRILVERAEPSDFRQLEQLARTNPDDRLALNALWALAAAGQLDESTALELLGHRDEDIRSWTVRFLGDQRKVPPACRHRMLELASSDASPRVRSQLACTAKRLDSEQALPILERLLVRRDDADDAYIPLLLWWAIEQHAIDQMDNLVDWLTSPSVREAPLIRDVILERLMRRYAAEGTAKSLSGCACLLDSATDRADQRMLIAALDEGLRLVGRAWNFQPQSGQLFDRFAAVDEIDRTDSQQLDLVPESLAMALGRVWEENTVDSTLIRLAMRLGSQPARARAVALATDENTQLQLRLEMLGVLGELSGPECVQTLMSVLKGADSNPPLQTAALRALGRFSDDRIASDVLSDYRHWDPAVQAEARLVLVGRESWTRLFLYSVDQEVISAKDVPIDDVRRIALHGDLELDALVRKHWGNIRSGTPEEKLAEMRRLNNDLRAADGDPVLGRPLFLKHCANCHRLFSDGNQVGPELTHANRKDRDFLLASLIDPSAQIRKEYMSYVVAIDDGRIVTGLIAEQTPASTTLLDAKNQRTVIPRNRIVLMKESNVSLMPDNLLEPLSPGELRDLFSYLQHAEPESHQPAGQDGR